MTAPILRKGPGRLHRFKSAEEEARFRETHSIADYWDQLEDADDPLTLSPALAAGIRTPWRQRLVTIRLEERQIARAKQPARRKGVRYQRLLREWIRAGIRAEDRKSKRSRRRRLG